MEKKKRRMRRMTLAESINEVYYQHYKTGLTIVIVKAIIIIKKYWADPILTILSKDTEIHAEN
jgi:hypothetical protein